MIMGNPKELKKGGRRSKMLYSLKMEVQRDNMNMAFKNVQIPAMYLDNGKNGTESRVLKAERMRKPGRI